MIGMKQLVKKIRDAEMNKIPFMLIVGEKEVKEKLMSVREHGGNDLGLMNTVQLTTLIKSKISKELDKE
jgi:threonyl-tRNA synthetase